MASITINNISNDNIINYQEYNSNLVVSGIVNDIPTGTTLTLTLDNKSITTTTLADKTFSFTIPSEFVSQSSELYVHQLSDKTAYIINISSTNPEASSSKAFYIDLSSNVMSYNTFIDGNGVYEGLPQDGDAIDAAAVNKGPTQNRKDILYLDSIVGDVAGIIDQKSNLYDNDANNDLISPNGTISNAISQLRVDVGNKNLLYTNTKSSLVSAINELKDNMYRPSQALNLVASYDYQTNGNYVLSGGNITYLETIPETSLPPKNVIMNNQPFQVIRDPNNYVTTSTEYNHFSLTPGKILVRGYETTIKSAMNLYFQNTITDDQPLHRRKYEDDVIMQKTSSSGVNDVYKILYLDSYIQGIYSITSVEGIKTFPQDFIFTTSGTAYQQLNNALKSSIQTISSITFDNVRLVSIPTTLYVNGVPYTCELDLNGYGINWTGNTPPAGISCTIINGSLIYKGVLESSGNLNNYISIAPSKDSILVNKTIAFNNGIGTISFTRVTPRYDKIIMSITHTDYKANYWDSSYDYSRNDIVVFNGLTWKALLDNSNIEPVEGSDWTNLGVTYEGVTTQPIFVYKEGYNNNSGYPVIPTNNSDDLVLCTILNVYGQPPIVKNEYVSAYKMTDIRKMEEMLNDGIYNLAKLSLTQNLSLSDSNLTKNMFVEPFFDNDLRDTELELGHIDSSASNSMFIQDGILTHSISFQNINTVVDTPYPYIQFDTTENSTVLVEQPLYSRSVLINKYQVTTPPIVKLNVYPQAFTWFDEEQNNLIIQKNATVDGAVVNYDSVSKIVNSSTSNTTTTSNWWSTTDTTTTKTTTVKESTEYRTDVLDSIINEPRKVPQYNLRITAPAYSFNGGEELAIQLGDLPQFAGVVSGNVVTATSNGALDATLVIGGDIKPFMSGDRKLTVIGIGTPHTPGTDYISGAIGTTTVTQTPFLKTINNYEIINRSIINTQSSVSTTTQTWDGGGDPLAQTFVAPKTSYLHSVYVMVDAINGNNSAYTVENSDTVVNETILPKNLLPEDLQVVLFGVTAGYPDYDKILAKGTLVKGTVINQLNPTYSRIELFPKVKLEKDKSYAFCVATGFETYARRDASGKIIIGADNLRLKLRSVKLGENYPNPGAKNILYNQQGYINGVMLSSSNMHTWTAHQEEDLTFKLTECLFTGGNKVVNFNINKISLTNITDIVFQAGVEVPGSTNITHKLKYGTGSLTANTSLISGEHKILGTKISSLNISQLESTLLTSEVPVSGKYLESPKLFREASLFMGTIDSVSTYVSKNIDLTDGSLFGEDKKLRVYLDFNNYDSNRVKIYYTTDEVINNSSSWIVMYEDINYKGPSGEKRFFSNSNDDSISLGDKLRIKIVFKTNINSQAEYTTRIGAKNLRVFAY